MKTAVITLTLTFGFNLLAPSSIEAQSNARWEYMFVSQKTVGAGWFFDANDLNELGKQGWEATGQVGDGILLKRRRK